MATSQSYRIPAIVAGGEVNGMGILRSLSAAQVPVYVLDADDTLPAMRSRYGNKVKVASLEGQAFMDALKKLLASFAEPNRAVLFLTEEKTVRTVSELRDQLPPGCKIQLPEHGRLMALMHKLGFQELAEELQSPVPRTVRLESRADLPKIEALRYPCVFKPSKKDYGYGARFKKAYKVNSPAEVAELYRDIEPILADMVVQEWIEGEDSEIYFCLQYVGSNGEAVASFPGRKIRSWPLRIGGTASCTSAWEFERELTELTSQFFRQVGFVGMGSMEYKRDSRDGRFYMVEPTVARTDFQEEVATLNGVNLPLAAYCHELGLPLPAVNKPAQPLIWRDPLSDKWALQELGKPDSRSQSFVVVDAYFRSGDIRPWFDFMWGRVKQRFGLGG